MVVLDSAYRGRFAPSPTGPLHFGSLYTAIASFLQARSKSGKWLVRIDDLDPFRCKQEYSSKILGTLEQYGLTWDEDVFYQSNRFNTYKNALEELNQHQLLYPCRCSRKDLASRQINNGIYDGYCLTHPPSPKQATSLRVKLTSEPVPLTDNIQGASQQNLQKDVGDFVLFRKDHVYAYHLAVILDDDAQGITEVLRGYDLLNSTYRQIYLQQLLQIQTPYYAHIPVISDSMGAKLSKQTFASDISLSPVNETLISAFRHLNLNPPNDLIASNAVDILSWGIKHWSLERIQPKGALPFQAH